MATEANKALVQQFLEEVINRGNLAAIDDFLAPDYVEHDALPPGLPATRAGFAQAFALFHRAFPDLRVTVDDALAEDDRVMVRQTFQGTHQGEFAGIAPTGRAVSFVGIDVVRIRDGRFAEHWSVLDNQGLLEQLGATATAGHTNYG